MKKHLVSTFILIVYITILIKVMVFKDMPTIRIGSLMLNFSGTDGGHPANFVPFKTILPYLLGDKGLIIAGANLVGNIAPLVPIGFLVPFVYRKMTWKKSLALAAAAGLAIEGMQVVLRLGIFDIDDLILNALGVMIGYWTFAILAKWVRSKNYKNVVFAAIIVIAALAVFYGAVVYPMSHQPVNRGVGAGGGHSDRSENKERQCSLFARGTSSSAGDASSRTETPGHRRSPAASCPASAAAKLPDGWRSRSSPRAVGDPIASRGGLLAQRDPPDHASCVGGSAAWRDVAARKLKDLDDHIEQAEAARSALQHALTHHRDDVRDCPRFWDAVANRLEGTSLRARILTRRR